MSEGRRHRVEHELSEWRAAKRREDAAETGSQAESDATDDATAHREVFQQLTNEQGRDREEELEASRDGALPAEPI